MSRTVSLLNNLKDDITISKVSQIKRVLECIAMVPGFKDELNENPDETIKKLNLNLTKEEVSFGQSTCDSRGAIVMHPTYDNEYSHAYADFMHNKFEYREVIKEDCVPNNPAMKKWRNRQIGRCISELGAKSTGLVHTVLTFELADGCSVGCEFCGLNAGRLKSIYKGTDENLKEFREVLNVCKDVMGDAAGEGTMYFATEPLDNPDYEKFLEVYLETFDRYPQITTARADRYIERLRPMLKDLTKDGRTIYRFSVISQDMLWKIFDAFTPEELILVEVLPQFPEAPSNHFTKTGRHADKAGGFDADTISCVSGFVVNMARKEIRLTTPAVADDEHPTGEHILDVRNFSDALEFKDIILSMIRKHMTNIVGPNDEIKLHDSIKVKTDSSTLILACRDEMEFRLDCKESIDLYLKIIEFVKDEFHTKRDIVKYVISMDEYKGITPEFLFYMLNRLYGIGIFKTKSGKV